MGLKGLQNTLNYRADRIRYLSPAPACSRIRGRVSIAEVADVRPDGLKVNYHLVIEIEGGQRTACVAELIVLHYRRDSRVSPSHEYLRRCGDTRARKPRCRRNARWETRRTIG
jgi:hypothetical protein